jgi:hypothetical protein
VDQNEAIQKAKQFAQNAYAAASQRILQERQDELAKMHREMAARGIGRSGMVVAETARISGEKIRALTEARLDTILEGYELYRVVIDDQMAADICNEVMRGMSQMVAAVKKNGLRGVPTRAVGAYSQLAEHSVGVSPAWVKTQIDRRRLMPKKPDVPSITTIYSVQGENARLNLNGTDNSVNVVTKSSSTEFFTEVRGQIESEIADGDERRKILEALTALEESHGKPSFAQRYTDFIAVAANHMAILAPFIPALTEMLHKAIS